MSTIRSRRAAWQIALSAGLLAIFFATPAAAQHRGHGPNIAEHIAELQEKLHLTDPQVDQIRALFSEMQPRLVAEPGLSAALARLARVQGLVRETPREGFRPGFAGRVLAGIAAAESPGRLSAALFLGFRRLVPAAFLVILTLLAHNLLTDGPEKQSVVEAALGLQRVTLEVAYEPDAALYLADP